MSLALISHPRCWLVGTNVSRVAAGIAICVAAFLPGHSAVGQTRLLRSSAHVPAPLAVLQGSAEPVGAPAPQSGGNAASPKDDLFAGTEKFAKGASEATEVNMDPDSLDLVGGSDAQRAHRTKLNTVHSYTYERPGMYNPADVEEYRRKLEGGGWHCSVRTRDLKSGETTDICNRRRAPDLMETAIITMAPKELTFIHTIRKADGQGGSIKDGGFNGLSEALPMGLPVMLEPQLEPQLEASLLASQASLLVLPSRLGLQSLPSLDSLQQQLNGTRMDSLPDATKELNQLEKQLQESERHSPKLP